MTHSSLLFEIFHQQTSKTSKLCFNEILHCIYCLINHQTCFVITLYDDCKQNGVLSQKFLGNVSLVGRVEMSQRMLMSLLTLDSSNRLLPYSGLYFFHDSWATSSLFSPLYSSCVLDSLISHKLNP